MAEFRTRHLNSRVLDPELVEQWIEQAAKADGEPTAFVTVPLDDAGQIAIPPEVINDHSKLPSGTSISHSLELLTYFLPGESWVRRIPVRLDGTLGALRNLAVRLGRRYGWAEAYVVNFLLTGQTPPPLRARVRTHEPWPWRRARRTISIEVPISTPPVDVAQAYRDARSDMLDEDKKPRSLTKKRAELAVFAFRHRKGRTWAELRQQWNEAHPKKQKTDDALFRRDCRQAFERITGENLPWEGKSH